jgi:hypothetical protein
MLMTSSISATLLTTCDLSSEMLFIETNRRFAIAAVVEIGM